MQQALGPLYEELAGLTRDYLDERERSVPSLTVLEHLRAMMRRVLEEIGRESSRDPASEEPEPRLFA